MTQSRSPWWYRRRAIVFGVIYFAGFAVGGCAPLMHLPQPPLFALLGPPWIFAALGLMTAAYAVRVWGSSYLRASTVWCSDARSSAFVDAGPFRYSRSPLYFGNILMAEAFALLAAVPGSIFIVIANLVFVELLAAHEERLMLETFGERYAAYAARVPKLFPNALPAPSACGIAPDLREGLRSEIFSGAMLAGMLLWAALPRYGPIAFCTCYVLGFLLQAAFNRRAVDPHLTSETTVHA